MAEDLFRVPLFPLNVVLFPGMALPLHIFEPRYREMTAQCLADSAPFGVALALPEGEQGREIPARVGTLARILHAQELPGGRYNLLAVGMRRFEVVELCRDKAYLTAFVRPYADRDDAVSDRRVSATEAQQALRSYLRVVMTLVGGEDRPIDIPDDPDDLSFLIGMCLTGDAEKQRLLEMTSTAARLTAGTEMLQAEAEALAHGADSITHLSVNHDRSILN